MAGQATTLGRELVRAALPEGYKEYADAPLDSGRVTGLTTAIARKDPALYVDTLQRLNDIGREASYLHGREASIRLRDLHVPPDLKQVRQDLKDRVRTIQNSPGLSSDQKLDAIQAEAETAAKGLDERIYKELLAANNSMARQIQSGARGKKGQLEQIVFGDMLMAGSAGELIPYPGLSGYGEGTTPFDYWLGAESARKGFIGTQLSTGTVGYFSKQLNNIGHRTVVTTADCGTTEGLEVDGADPDNTGAVLLRDAGPLKAGAILKEEHLPLLDGRRITVRSPLACRAREGVCQHCTGVRERGGFPELGEPVGINAVRSFSEGVTQAALGSKHLGGKAQRGGGFKEIDAFVQVPQEYPGGATLAEADGQVGKVQEAPQGGTYVLVSGKQYHVPAGRAVTVKAGDRLEAGDMISDGIPNPAEIVQHKGMGEGRRYFMQQFRQILKNNSAGTNRRNLELFARAFVSRVRVTDPKGYQGRLVDDVVDYDTLAADWEPREGAGLKSVTTAGNLYLERPYMHYSIGTRVTPSVSKALRASGVKDVMVHKDPPPFEPVVTRAQDFLRHDKDWLTRMGGENLGRATLDAAARGAVSEPGTVSYYPQLVRMGG